MTTHPTPPAPPGPRPYPDGLYRFSTTTGRGPVVVGLVVEGGRVVHCAPYARTWALMRSIRAVVEWARGSWRIEVLG